MKTINYEKQAQCFLKKTNTEFSVKFKRHDLYFPSDDEKRDIYEITLSRNGRSYSFEFGQSINCTGKYIIVYESGKYHAGDVLHGEAERKKAHLAFRGFGKFYKENENFEEPTAYSVLACLGKYEPGTFEDFCGEFGYDTDSRTAEKTYNAVAEQYKQLCMLYSTDEMTAMAEIS